MRARGVGPDAVRVSFIKVVELQARLIPHIHALIRLDPPDGDDCGGQDWLAPLTAVDLAPIIQQAARTVAVTVTDSSSDTATRVIRFGAQVDTQPIDNGNAGTDSAVVQDGSPHGAALPGRRVARYLAKYVTKSLADLGISARRLSAEAIADLDVSEHVRTILTTITQLGDRAHHVGIDTLVGSGAGCTPWATEATSQPNPAATRPLWENCAPSAPPGPANKPSNTQPQHDRHSIHRAARCQCGGSSTTPDTPPGDFTLVYSAALQRIHTRRIGLVEARPSPRSTMGSTRSP